MVQYPHHAAPQLRNWKESAMFEPQRRKNRAKVMRTQYHSMNRAPLQVCCNPGNRLLYKTRSFKSLRILQRHDNQKTMNTPSETSGVKRCELYSLTYFNEPLLISRQAAKATDPKESGGEAGVVVSSAANSTTTSIEPQRPSFGTGQYHGFSFRGPRSAFQSSVDSTSFKIHHNSQHGNEYKPAGDAAQPRSFQPQYHSRSTTTSARNQDSYAKRQQNKSAKPKPTHNAQLLDETW